jgi:hypothetical protein
LEKKISSLRGLALSEVVSCCIEGMLVIPSIHQQNPERYVQQITYFLAGSCAHADG